MAGINLDKLLNAFPQKGDPIRRYEPPAGVTASGAVIAPPPIVSGVGMSDSVEVEVVSPVPDGPSDQSGSDDSPDNVGGVGVLIAPTPTVTGSGTITPSPRPKGEPLTREELDGILDLHKQFLRTSGKLGKRAELPGVNLQGANLQDFDLSGAFLRGANLQGANLHGAKMEHADLQGGNLQRADLRGANMQRVDLLGANMQHADLQGANLQRAILTEAQLQGADLRSTNTNLTYLHRALYNSQTKFNEGFDPGSQGMVLR